MCNNCKECIIREYRDTELENLNEIVKNLNKPTKVKVDFIDGKEYKGIIKNNDSKIVISDGNNEDYLCNILEFIADIKTIEKP